MRNFLLLCFVIAFSTIAGNNLFAQSGRTRAVGQGMEGFGASGTPDLRQGIICDTTSLDYPLDDTLVLYSSSGWGFASGHNDYGDIAKAQRYENFQGYPFVLGVRLTFLYAKAANQNSKVTVHLWDEVAGKPGTSLASTDLYISDIINNSGDVTAWFGFIPVTGPFYVGFQFGYAPGDTVAVATNTDGDTDPATAWEQWSDSTWYPYDDADSWGLKVASAIYPMVRVGQFTVTITPPSATIMSSQSVSLTAAGAFGPNTTHHWWPATGLSCTSCTTTVASPTVTTTYYAYTADPASCPVTASAVVTVTPFVGVEDNLFNGHILTYPNPNNGEFMLSFSQAEATDLTIGLYNNLGQIVYSEELLGFVGNYNKAINWENVSKGVYTLRITDDQQRQYVAKMAVE